MSKAARVVVSFVALFVALVALPACGSNSETSADCEAAVARIDNHAPDKTTWLEQIKDSMAKCASSEAWLGAAKAHPDSFGYKGAEEMITPELLNELCTLADGGGLPACE